MEIINKDIEKYILNHVSDGPPLLKKIERETFSEVLMPRMLSGHFQGRVLSMISKMIKPRNILEIGTYTGYSALCLAEGVAEGGRVYTIDINEELENRVRGYFTESEVGDKINYIIGDALTKIPELEVNFDLVFIDADKINYSNYFDLVIDKVNPGGIMIADNVLWDGKVTQGEKVNKDTQAILDFNKKIQRESRIENLIFPIRDGLMLMRKL